jgi:endonuclease VIII-like 1
MPEISEVRLTSEWITQKNKKRTITEVEYLSSNKLKMVEEIDVIGKTLSASSRGKELRLEFDFEPVVITLGMSGGFKNYKERSDDSDKHWKHSHIRFKMSDGDWFTWSDIRRFGKSLGDTWGKKRGPDIFDEEEEFRKNIVNNIEHRDFNKPAHEVLMNQQWFNGIGNYLRAEILGKWDVNPFQPIRNIINKPFLDHLIEQVHWSYRLGGGQLYTWMNENESAIDFNLTWNDWMQFYGKQESMKDKQKRTFWFNKKYCENNLDNSK